MELAKKEYGEKVNRFLDDDQGWLEIEDKEWEVKWEREKLEERTVKKAEPDDLGLELCSVKNKRAEIERKVKLAQKISRRKTKEEQELASVVGSKDDPYDMEKMLARIQGHKDDKQSKEKGRKEPIKGKKKGGRMKDPVLFKRKDRNFPVEETVKEKLVMAKVNGSTDNPNDGQKNCQNNATIGFELEAIEVSEKRGKDFEKKEAKKVDGSNSEKEKKDGSMKKDIEGDIKAQSKKADVETKKEVELGYHQIVIDLRVFCLRCSACKIRPRRCKVYQCSSGHLVCEGCLPSLQTCDICNTSLPDPPSRSLVAEECISSIGEVD